MSKKLGDRINSSQALSNEREMHILEESSASKVPETQQHAAKHLMPTRSSIPVLSTKHFLEGGSIADHR